MMRAKSSLENTPSGRLRILATTDLHMQLLDYDYFGDRDDPTIGLVGLADQIAALRDAPDVTTVLCDNGDLIQGNPLADYLAQSLGPDDIHPMIAALNLLQYDALTLGNHEFDYGLEFLRATFAKASAAVVCANITPRRGSVFAKPFAILEREIVCDDDTTRPIKIGITGFAPPKIADWFEGAGHADVTADDIVDAARTIVPQMKAAGAEIIIALCHSGMGATQQIPRMENAAIPLAAVDGIDVLVTGHTHEAFPDSTIASTATADYKRGSLHGKPAVMAGFCGQSLGVIDLTLQWSSDSCGVSDYHVHNVKAVPSEGTEGALPQQLRALVTQPHAATISTMQEPIAQTDVPIVSYFATVQPDLSQQLLAQAMQRAIIAALKDGPDAAFPVLAATSSFRFGGRSGLGHYIDIPKGAITLRDAAAIFPFSDDLFAVRRTGRQLRLWLERSAAHYNLILPGQQDQPLIDPQSAGYNCDTMHGLSYQIDLTQPARFDVHGCEINPEARRIVQMTYQGGAVADDDIFVVATNCFRARGGGSFPKVAQTDIVHTAHKRLRDILIADLKSTGTVRTDTQTNWSFIPIAGTTATFVSAPQALDHLRGPFSHVGPVADGLERYRLHF